MLEFTYTVNFCDFSSKGQNSGPMTEQKQEMQNFVTLVSHVMSGASVTPQHCWQAVIVNLSRF